MFQSLKQLFILAGKSKKAWLIPLFLLLIIAALLIISAELAPVPLFLYPII